MAKLGIVHEGAIYRNPDPGHRALCAYLPNVVPLSDQELCCFYRIGQAFYSHDGRIARVRSRDGGRTWAQEGLVWDPRQDRHKLIYTAPHATLLRDGTLLLTASRYPADEQNLTRFNPETGGMKSAEVVLFQSNDGGHHWSKPEPLDLGGGPIDPPSSILELDNGHWFLACESWKDWSDPTPIHIKGFALFSVDGGKTWKDRVDFPSASRSDRMFSHSRYTRMLDGRICALQWTQSIGGKENHDLHFVISDASGRKWSQPQPTGIGAQTSWVADLGNGLLAATFTVRERRRPGIAVTLSHNEGKTWELEDQVLVWDAVGQEFLGVTHKPDYPASHDNIAFGKPNTARLPCGDIICSWWCTQACVTHIRYARLTLD